MIDPLFLHALRRFKRPTVALLAVLIVGTVGFHVIGGEKSNWFDAFYMTFITISTIGFTEVFDMTGRPGARMFTVFIAASGIGVMTFMLSTATAYIVEGEMNDALRRRKMEKRIAQMSGHYVVCGMGRVGANVVHELLKTERKYVAIDVDGSHVATFVDRDPEAMCIVGDGSEDETLLKAGIERAAGVFAVTGDDSKNLVITLTAKQLRPDCRVVARCHEINYFSKMQKVGADAIVSPDFTGGMRIVSSMIRPQVVSFLDEMLRTDDSVRVEEITLGPSISLALGQFAPPSPDYIVLAVKRGLKTQFNPGHDYALAPLDVVVIMANPAGRQRLEDRVATA